MLFREKLRFLRKINNMSQEELAEKLIVSRQAVSRWETGDTIPDAEILLQLGEIFGVSVDNLLKENLSIDNCSVTNQEADKNINLLKTLGICTVIVSVLVILCLTVLSSVYPVYGKHFINGGANVLYKANIFTFLNKYHLEWLLALDIFLFGGGTSIIVIDKIKRHKRLKKGVNIYEKIFIVDLSLLLLTNNLLVGAYNEADLSETQKAFVEIGKQKEITDP